MWFQSDRSACGQQTGQPDAGYPQRKSLNVGVGAPTGQNVSLAELTEWIFPKREKGNPLLVDFILETAMAIVGRLHVQNS